MRRHGWNARVHRGNQSPRSLPQPPSLPWSREERPVGAYQRFLRAPTPSAMGIQSTQGTRGRDSQTRPIFVPAGTVQHFWPAPRRTTDSVPQLSMNSSTTSQQRQSKKADRCQASRLHEEALWYFEQPEVVSAAVSSLLGERDDELRRRSAACLLAAESAAHSEKQLTETQAKLRVSKQQSDDLLQVVLRIATSPSKLAMPSTGAQDTQSSRTNGDAGGDLLNSCSISQMVHSADISVDDDLDESAATYADSHQAIAIDSDSVESTRKIWEIDDSIAEKQSGARDFNFQIAVEDESRNLKEKLKDVRADLLKTQALCENEQREHERGRPHVNLEHAIFQHDSAGTDEMQNQHHCSTLAVSVRHQEVAAIIIQSQVRGVQVRSRANSLNSHKNNAAPAGLPNRCRGSQKMWDVPGAELTMDEAKGVFNALDTNSDGKISMLEFIRGLRCMPDLARKLHLPTVIRQEEESRKILQHAFGEMDVDLSKNISLDEFLSFYLRPIRSAEDGSTPRDAGFEAPLIEQTLPAVATAPLQLEECASEIDFADAQQQDEAFRRLQSRLRSKLARYTMDQLRASCVTIQTSVRCHRARCEAAGLESERRSRREHLRAAVVLQSRVRVLRSRTLLEAARDRQREIDRMSVLENENEILRQKISELEDRLEGRRVAVGGKQERPRLPVLVEELGGHGYAANGRDEGWAREDAEILAKVKALEGELRAERMKVRESWKELQRVTEMHQRVQEELKIEVESVSALQWERSNVQKQLQQEQEDREREQERMVDMIANLAGKESEQEEDMKTARERVREIEMREREMKTLLELQLEEAKQREAALKKTEVKEREKRGALEDELKLASASILRLERDREELRARSQKAEDLAREKAIALYGELKREQDAVKALKVDIKVETEKAAAVVAQEQERASELVQKLAVARECVLQSERREQEAVATLEGELERSMSRWGKRIGILEEQVQKEQQQRRILEESLDRKRVQELEQNAARLLAMHRQLALKMMLYEGSDDTAFADGIGGTSATFNTGSGERASLINPRREREQCREPRDDCFVSDHILHEDQMRMRRPFPPQSSQSFPRTPRPMLLSPIPPPESHASAQDAGGRTAGIGRGLGLRDLRTHCLSLPPEL